ncbi:MAG: L-seryl-tRNA(Sec) selenium transferase [Syntrophomonadaceae bacterium]|nr:L-seryl-tRNA(Sec) selenium transferase [Syntrophomonadaceae bacterium]
MDIEVQNLLRHLPSVEELLQAERTKRLITDGHPRPVVVALIRQALQECRGRIQGGEYLATEAVKQIILEKIEEKARDFSKPNLRPVINATGVILHTNLGRAVLSQRAKQAIAMVAEGYSNLEMDLGTGERGSRYHHVAALLANLTGAEGAMVVNNNAAAVLLTLTALARGKEVIVSRGQLVEIGGSFRVPEVMAQSGAQLVEVGTTNKTYLRDYEQAISEKTAMLLKVHTSNYRVVGFTKETATEELVALGRSRKLPVAEDLGSGFLLDLSAWGISDEPTVQDSVAKGVDIVTFSGDKLLGGPQAGIIVGKKELITRLQAHPLTRALRIDKLTMAALEATLREYLDFTSARENIPTIKMLTATKEEMRQAAAMLLENIQTEAGREIICELMEDWSEAGGGSLPVTFLPTWVVALSGIEGGPERLAGKLRSGDPPIIARIKDHKLMLDPRTVLPDEGPLLAKALAKCLG